MVESSAAAAAASSPPALVGLLAGFVGYLPRQAEGHAYLMSPVSRNFWATEMPPKTRESRIWPRDKSYICHYTILATYDCFVVFLRKGVNY